MGFQFTSDKSENGVVIVSIEGDIDMSTSPKIRDALAPLFKENCKGIVVDLAGVSYMDSSGIATLVEGLQWSHSSNNKFRLVNLTPGVRDVFEIARLLTVFEVFDSKEEALQI